MPFRDVAEVGYDPHRARVFEQGWQSWSPSAAYRIGEAAPRAATDTIQTLAYRPGMPIPDGCYQSEGVLALDPGDGSAVRLWSGPGLTEVPSLRLRPMADRLVVSANGPVREAVYEGGAASLESALAAWADEVAAQAGLEPVPAVAPLWCSWYGYWDKVTEADIATELALIERHGLDIGLILLDDGYEAGIGDWLTVRDGFGSLPDTARRVRDTGRRAGIWVAPFLVGQGSELFGAHPDWLVDGADAGRMWDQDLSVLDVTHPAAAEYLAEVFRALTALGFDHFKLDYLYAGALIGRRHADVGPNEAYRRGLEIIREAVGPDATLHGCGAPLLPSVGRVDIMRVGPDMAPTVLPKSGDISQPCQHGARLTSGAREFLHARWWVNDPDCLIVRPGIEEREQWAAFLASCGGLRGASDPLAALDAWGLATTRRLLRPSATGPTA